MPGSKRKVPVVIERKISSWVDHGYNKKKKQKQKQRVQQHSFAATHRWPDQLRASFAGETSWTASNIEKRSAGPKFRPKGMEAVP